MLLFLDTETRGPYPGALHELGLYGYARHTDTRLLLVSYAIDDGPEVVWDIWHDPVPPRDLAAALRSDCEIIAHNAMFDRVIASHHLGVDDRSLKRWHCTAARARVHGLPGELDMLSKIYKLGVDAKANGKALIDLFCEKGADPDQHPMEWLEFIDYSRQDITALRALYKLLPAWEWTDRQKRMYVLDQQINDRGFAVDLTLAQKMIEASDICKASLDRRVHALTDGLIDKGTQRAKVQTWINGGSVLGDEPFALTDMKAETLRKALREHKAGRVALTAEQIEMIELRLLSSKSSTAKCKTALKLAGPDSRIRGAITFNGGGRIGRFSHKGFQPGNLPRPNKAFEDKELVEMATAAIFDGTVTTIWGDEAMAVCANVLRGLIVASPGRKLVVADYSNIEGRVLAWFAGEEWKLKSYFERDAGIGEDSYKLLFHRMTGIPIENIDGFLRQQGKGVDLACGYEGSVGALLNIANSYQLDLVALSQSVPLTLPQYMHAGQKSWEWAVANDETHDLSQEIYVACSALVHAYREANSCISTLWQTLLNCAREAVRNPGKLFTCADGKVCMKANAEWLAVQIPSGRKIMFAKPRIETKPVIDKNTKLPKLDANGDPVLRTQLTALKSPGWVREGIYGGLIANAITQGLSRDILVDALLDLNAEGYPIVLHVHDEADAELNDSDVRDHEDMIAVMLRQSAKYPGLPLAAAGFTTKRYRKG